MQDFQSITKLVVTLLGLFVLICGFIFCLVVVILLIKDLQTAFITPFEGF